MKGLHIRIPIIIPVKGRGFINQGLGYSVFIQVAQNEGYHFGCPNNKDHRVLGSTLGSPCFGKLPNPKTDVKLECQAGPPLLP